MKYMIHSCNSRQWYVDNFLVPSMIEQGIKEEDIYVYQDKECKGNLKAFIDSCKKAIELWGLEERVWHLQDDVLIASYFKEYTERLTSNTYLKYMFICGFTTDYDDGKHPGPGFADKDMWYSFPCIMIPNEIAKNFTDWYNVWVERDPQYGFWVRQKKGDDFIFKVFVESFFPLAPILNVAPNLVEHIDYMIGGTIVNPQRKMKSVRSLYWNENDLVNDLMDKIVKYKEEHKDDFSDR